MDSLASKQLKMRVSSDHWRVLLDFAESHPEIITNKFSNHLQGKKTNMEFWEQLTVKLNSLGLGVKSVEYWKKCLTDWKSKTKAKVAKINKYTQQTGGGPVNPIKLTLLEERLLSLMGTTAIYGDNTVEEKGIKRKIAPEEQKIHKKAFSIEPDKENVEPESYDNIEDIIVDEVLVNDHEYFIINDYSENSSVNINEMRDQQENTTDETMEKPTTQFRSQTSGLQTQRTAKRLQNTSKNYINSMHNDILHILNSIGTNIGSISKSLEKLVEHVCKE